MTTQGESRAKEARGEEAEVTIQASDSSPTSGQESAPDPTSATRELDKVGGSQTWLQTGIIGEPLKYPRAPVLIPSGTDLIGLMGSGQAHYLKALGFFPNMRPKLRSTSQDDP